MLSMLYVRQPRCHGLWSWTDLFGNLMGLMSAFDIKLDCDQCVILDMLLNLSEPQFSNM